MAIHEMSCGCFYDSSFTQKKDGVEKVVNMVGECLRISMAAFDVPAPLPESDERIKAWRLVANQHHYDIEAHPEWNLELPS